MKKSFKKFLAILLSIVALITIFQFSNPTKAFAEVDPNAFLKSTNLWLQDDIRETLSYKGAQDTIWLEHVNIYAMCRGTIESPKNYSANKDELTNITNKLKSSKADRFIKGTDKIKLYDLGEVVYDASYYKKASLSKKQQLTNLKENIFKGEMWMELLLKDKVNYYDAMDTKEKCNLKVSNNSTTYSITTYSPNVLSASRKTGDKFDKYRFYKFTKKNSKGIEEIIFATKMKVVISKDAAKYSGATPWLDESITETLNSKWNGQYMYLNVTNDWCYDVCKSVIDNPGKCKLSEVSKYCRSLLFGVDQEVDKRVRKNVTLYDLGKVLINKQTFDSYNKYSIGFAANIKFEIFKSAYEKMLSEKYDISLEDYSQGDVIYVTSPIDNDCFFFDIDGFKTMKKVGDQMDVQVKIYYEAEKDNKIVCLDYFIAKITLEIVK